MLAPHHVPAANRVLKAGFKTFVSFQDEITSRKLKKQHQKKKDNSIDNDRCSKWALRPSGDQPTNNNVHLF